MDNYFVNREDNPRDSAGNYDFEALEALDIALFNNDMGKLLQGMEVELPTFDFVEGKRLYKGNTLKLEKDDILVIEGIHCLNEKMTYTLPKESKFKIYISALTQLNVDEHNRISTTDCRLLRRIVRDARTRGTGAEETLARWQSVRNGEERNIFPFQEEADVMFNSALIYELAVLKQYVEPLFIWNTDRQSLLYRGKENVEIYGLFSGVSSDSVPANSLLREFIGGGCFGCRMKKLHNLTKEKKNVIVLTVSKMDGRGCKCRKAAVRKVRASQGRMPDNVRWRRLQESATEINRQFNW